MLQAVDSAIKEDFGGGGSRLDLELCDRTVMRVQGCWTPRSFLECVFKQFVPSSESLR